MNIYIQTQWENEVSECLYNFPTLVYITNNNNNNSSCI